MSIMLSKNSAFTLVEAMVAAVIFTIAVAGVFSSMAAIKKPTVSSDNSTKASLCGQQVLANLRVKVDASVWDSATNDYTTDLRVGHHVLDATALASYDTCKNCISGVCTVVCTGSYDVSCETANCTSVEPRKVVATISCP